LQAFQLREFTGTHRSGNTRFVLLDQWAPAKFSLNGAFHIREGVRGVPIARESQGVMQEAETRFITCEPGGVEALLIVVSIMRCTA